MTDARQRFTQCVAASDATLDLARAALLISAVVVLLFVAFLTRVPLAIPIAILFSAAMIATATGFAIFLH